MTHSPEQMRKKDMARKESMDHYHNANVMHERGGMDHMAHKSKQMAAEDANDGDADDMRKGAY